MPNVNCDISVVQDFDKLAGFMKKSYSKTLQKKDLSLKGWNWGTAEFQGKYWTTVYAAKLF